MSIKPAPISVQCLIRYNVTVSDPWKSIIGTATNTKRGEYLMFFFKITQAVNLLLHKIKLCSLTFSDLAVILAMTVYERCTQDSSVAKTQGSRTIFLFSYYSTIPENLFKGYFFTARVDFGVVFLINFFSSSAFLASEKLWNMTPCPLRLVSLAEENF